MSKILATIVILAVMIGVAGYFGSSPVNTVSLETKQPVILIFTAKWCSYCHTMAKERETNGYLKAELAKFEVRILDYDKHRVMASRYYVFAVPTTIAVDPDSGKVVYRQMGYKSPGEVIQMLQRLKR